MGCKMSLFWPCIAVCCTVKVLAWLYLLRCLTGHGSTLELRLNYTIDYILLRSRKCCHLFKSLLLASCSCASHICVRTLPCTS